MPSPMPRAPSSRPLAHQIQRLANLLGSRGLGDGLVARQEFAGIVHDRHARGNVAGGGAEIDQRLAFALRVPGPDRVYAHLQFQRGGDAVASLEAVVLRRLSVRMQVDETGGDHQSGGVDGRAALRAGRLDTASILPLRMPMFRTASRLDAGSITRPWAITRSYCCASSGRVSMNRTAFISDDYSCEG